MSLLDIIGPVMIGPSSSHTAGAVRLGLLARRVWMSAQSESKSEPASPSNVIFYLRGSFAATYWGHGTDRGLVAGILGMLPDDTDIPVSFEKAREAGVNFKFETEEIDGAHPNSVRIVMSGGASGARCEIIGASIGGGAVELQAIDGFPVRVSGDVLSLISFHKDVPGVIASLAEQFYFMGLNIARMDLSRNTRGGMAAAVFELEGEVPPHMPELITKRNNAVQRVVLLSKPDEHHEVKS